MDAEARYVKTARNARIAYAVIGTGPINVLIGPASVALEPLEQRSGWISCAQYARKIEYDHGGNGLSTEAPRDYSFDGLYAEFEAVADAASPDDSLVLVGSYSSGPLAIRYAAERPSRVRRLVLHNSWARGADYFGQPGWAAFREALGADWSVGASLYTRIGGGVTGAAARQMARLIAGTIDQESYLAFLDAIIEHDATAYLSRVNVPTRVVYNPNMTFALDPPAKQLAAKISGATLSAAPPFPKRDADNTPFERAARRWIMDADDDGAGGDDETVRQPTPDEAGLSEREVQVLQLVARGLTNKEVADRLSLQPSTVARHVHHLLQKTGCINRTQLTAYAHRMGLIEGI
jgi:DNA-binding CsgD family transcriptional regulator/pimeloyl-ACP methyl ester carboxylesterase